MFKYFNPNPKRRKTDDCVIRAICKLINKDWYYVYVQLCVQGFIECDWGNYNRVWAIYLRNIGYKRRSIPDTCPDCYTVNDFCKDYPYGKYLLATGTHTVTVVDGDYYDTFDSGEYTPIFY